MTGSLRVERYAGSGEEWDAFARTQSGWTLFHLYGWNTVIAQVFGHECPYLVARDKAGAMVGILPLVRVKSLLFGHYLVSMPFLNYGGPLGSEPAVAALAAAAGDLAASGGVKLLELRNRVEQPLGFPVSHRKITVVLDIPPIGPEALWKQLDGKVRNQVRRPQKEGITVRFGRDQVAAFYSVFAHNMRDLGTPAQPRRLFECIADTFGDDVWFACAYHAGKPVAGGCGFRWGNEFEMTWASALTAYSRMAPNMLLYWSFIERAATDGLTLFNFGRCSPGSGTHKFKLQWGGRDEPLWWYQRAAPGSRAATPSPDDAAFSWGPRLWRYLPVSLATLLGPRIVKSIP